MIHTQVFVLALLTFFSSISLQKGERGELRSLKGHAGSVSSVTFSPDGKTLASGAYRLDGEDQGPFLYLWNVADGVSIAKLQGNYMGIRGLAFAPDGKSLASCGNDLVLWSARDNKHIAKLEGNGHSVAFSADGKWLAWGGMEVVVRIANQSLTSVSKINAHAEVGVGAVVFSPDSRVLASSGTRDNKIKLWDVGSRDNIISCHDAHRFGVFSLAFSKDGKTLASGGADKPVKGGGGPPDGDVHLWDVASGKRIRTLLGHERAVFAVAFSPDGKTLATGSRDTTIRLWDYAAGKQVGVLRGHTEDVYCVAFSPDGKMLASGSKDKTIKLWDLQGK